MHAGSDFRVSFPKKGWGKEFSQLMRLLCVLYCEETLTKIPPRYWKLLLLFLPRNCYTDFAYLIFYLDLGFSSYRFLDLTKLQEGCQLKPVLQIRFWSDPVFLGQPDPDPGKNRIRILYPQKYTRNSTFLVIQNCLKLHFCQHIFFLILSVVRRFGKKMTYSFKFISQKDPDPVFLGDPDPDQKKNGPDPQHW